MEPLQSSKTAEEYFKEGIEAYYYKPDEQKALESFTTTLETNPNYFQAYAERANILRLIGKEQEALEEIDKSIAIQKNAVAYFIKVRLLAELGNEEVKLYFELGSSIEAEDEFTLFHKGSALSILGQKEAALDCYEQVIKLRPEFTLAYHNKGLTFSDLGQQKEAITCYDRVIQLQPGYALVYFNKGRALSVLGQHEAAINFYEKALQLRPNDGFGYYDMGVAFANLGQTKKAIICYKKAVKFNPGNANAYWNMGCFFSDSKQKETAIACYKKAAQLRPHHLEYIRSHLLYIEKSLHALKPIFLENKL